MRFFLPTVILASCGLLLLPALPHAVAQEPEDTVEDEGASESAAEELRDAQIQMHLSQLRLAAMLTEHNFGMLAAQTAVDAARTALNIYDEFDAEIETISQQLELDYARDGLADSIEELDQLAIMYERNALATATAQIVMDRSERSIERQKVEVSIEEKSLHAWHAVGQGNRQKGLAHEALLAQASLEATISSQELELAELEAEMVELERTIKELKAEVAAEGADNDTESEG